MRRPVLLAAFLLSLLWAALWGLIEWVFYLLKNEPDEEEEA